jgi:hypothetical protein
MTVKKRGFKKGVILKPDDDALEGIEGEIKVGDTSKKIEAHLDGQDREVLTDDQTQTVTNKTIDVDNNTVSNIETDNLKAGVLNTDPAFAGATDTQIPSALAVKTALDGQNEASEITYAPDGSKIIDGASTNVQAGMDDLDDDAKLMRDTSGTAKGDANMGTFTGTTISDNVSIKAGMQELETASETNSSDLSTHIADVTTHGTTGNIVGDSDVQTLTNKTITIDDDKLLIRDDVDNTKKVSFDLQNITCSS